MKERKEWAQQFSKIAIALSSTGTAVTLGEIATISDGFEEGAFHSLSPFAGDRPGWRPRCFYLWGREGFGS